jgi:hypothetical protein
MKKEELRGEVSSFYTKYFELFPHNTATSNGFNISAVLSAFQIHERATICIRPIERTPLETVPPRAERKGPWFHSKSAHTDSSGRVTPNSSSRVETVEQSYTRR